MSTAPALCTLDNVHKPEPERVPAKPQARVQPDSQAPVPFAAGSTGYRDNRMPLEERKAEVPPERAAAASLEDAEREQNSDSLLRTFECTRM